MKGKPKNIDFMQLAIDLAMEGMKANEGGPFGAVVVKDGKIIGRGNNQVLRNHDPTAHAEIVAIRDACNHIKDFQLTGCVIYCSCEPCPMCLGAIYWARPDHIYFAASRIDAAKASFDDEMIYHEISAPFESRKIPVTQLESSIPAALSLFKYWDEKEYKLIY